MAQDLRSYLEAVKTARPEDFVLISKEVDPAFEITALVVKQLKKEGVLRLSGLGIFRKRKSKARIGRNPATGEQIKIPARTRLRFTPAKGLKDAVLGAR